MRSTVINDRVDHFAPDWVGGSDGRSSHLYEMAFLDVNDRVLFRDDPVCKVGNRARFQP